MMRLCFGWFISLSLLTFAWAAPTTPPAAELPVAYPAPAGPDIDAKAYLLIDLNAQQVLTSKQADQPVEPASLTKLMTAYVVFDALKTQKIQLQQTFPVSVRAWKMEGSRMFIDPKMSVRVEDLLKGMIVQSGNDATIALAEGVAGSVDKFVQRMNAQAMLLGMKNTQYKNPEGLTEAGHTTTADDLAILATRLLQDFPQHMHYYALQKYRLEGSPKSNDTNRNKLLFLDSQKTGFTVDGLKTGHTDAAGYCLVATAKQGTPAGERRLLSIVLGADSEKTRATESEKLLAWGFQAYDAVKLFEAKQAVVRPRLWKGEQAQLPIGLASGRALWVAVPKGLADQIATHVQRQDVLLAPVAQGEHIADLAITLKGQPWRQIKLQALEAVARAGWLSRLLDSVRLWWR